MSISNGLITWLNTCPQITVVDMHQTDPEGNGLYKEPSVIVEDFLDGTQLKTENYYVLFSKNAQLKSERISNEEVLDNFERWIFNQELDGNYPSIGYPVQYVEMTNSPYMMSREKDSAVYQAEISIQYIYGGTND